MTQVRVHGLSGRPELNGREGVVVEDGTTTQRIAVLLEGEAKPLALKPDNLQPLALSAGTRVQLVGLETRSDLNGQSGAVESTDEATERVTVRLDPGDREVSVRAERLKLLLLPARRSADQSTALHSSKSSIAARDIAALDDDDTTPSQPLSAPREASSKREDDAYKAVDKGTKLLDQGKLQEAEVCLRAGYKAGHESHGALHATTLTAANNLGAVLARMGKQDEAEAFFREATDGKRKVLGPRDPDTLSGIAALAGSLQKQGKTTESVQLYKEAVAGRREVLGVQHPSTLMSMSNLGGTLMDQGRLIEAKKVLQETVARCQEVFGGDHPGTQASTSLLNTVLKKLAVTETQANKASETPVAAMAEAADEAVLAEDHGHAERAIECLTQSLAIHREYGNRVLEGDVSGNLGAAYLQLGRHELAIGHLTKALAIHIEVGNRDAEGVDRDNLAKAEASFDKLVLAEIQKLHDAALLERDQGTLRGAIPLFEQCLARAGRLRNLASAKHVEGAISCDLATVYKNIGAYEHAIEHFTHGLLCVREIDHKVNEGVLLGNLGNLYSLIGQQEAAIQHFTQALALHRVCEDLVNEGLQLMNLGVSYTQLGSHDLALEHLTQALTVIRKAGNRSNRFEEAGCLGNLAIAYETREEYGRAIDHHTQARSIYSERGNRIGEATAIGGLAGCFAKLGQHKRALEHHKEALTIVRNAGDQQSVATTLMNIGIVLFRDQRDYDSALPFLQESAAVLDTIWAALVTDDRRVSYGDNFSLAGVFLQMVHASLGQPEAALEVAERVHSRSLEVLLAEQRLGSGATALGSSTNAEPLSYDALFAAATQLQLTIVIFSVCHTDTRRAATLLLAWVVDAGTPLEMKTISIPEDEQSIEQLIKRTRSAIRDEGDAQSAVKAELSNDDKEPDPVHALLRRCYDLLITPLSLAEGKPLLIIPDRDLYALPFAALIDADGKYLIERHSLQVAPSVGTVIELQKRAESRVHTAPSAMVVGNPAFNGWAPQLPGAELEAVTVFEELETATYAASAKLGATATKAAVVEAMRGCDVIHLATHGTADGVLLSGATKAEGKLSMGEVQGLELRARLVVLSECNSFRGRSTADGVVGIARAFVAAGALTLVASLWKVDDAATRELMERFYKRLLSGGVLGNVAAAMQAAMTSMIRDRHWSVYQWASFVVYGLSD